MSRVGCRLQNDSVEAKEKRENLLKIQIFTQRPTIFIFLEEIIHSVMRKGAKVVCDVKYVGKGDLGIE